ncbi:MAG: nucleoside hydrolase [Gammaproteobacteria bacterium]|nr:nucleoside hydrolase [Gammaproteobacteria bacterium]
MKKRPVIIDCDPGHDDAIALIMAFSNISDFDVLAVTSTAGNQTIEKTTLNVQKILTLLDKSPLIGQGSAKPMVRELEIAPAVHGQSGLDGPELPEPKVPVTDNAWDLSYRLIKASEDPVTLIATGPLTNLGILFTAHPEVKSNIKEIVIMGGGIERGNWTAAAEFNILVDPEAANIVFTSGIPLIMCGLDVTEKAKILPDEVERFRATQKKIPVFIAELVDFFSHFHIEMGFDGTPLHDPCAVAYLLKPDMFTTEKLHVAIETQGKLTTGMTVADRRINSDKKPANVMAVMDVNREQFIEFLYQCGLAY